jgi:ABC-type bacteriocin/lantibiotic exporter with double-glycine peptidase domain
VSDMSSDLLNILSNSNKDIDNQKLMDYISGRLSGKDKHEVEQWMIDNNFENEALEGLQTIKNKKDLEAYVNQLNKELNQYLQQKKHRRDRRKIKEIPWSYLAIVIVLLLIFIAYLVIQKIQK